MTEISTKLSNGVTEELMAVAGYSVFMTCHGLTPDWPNEKTDKLSWTMAAANAIVPITQAKADPNGTLSIHSLTVMIHQWMSDNSSARQNFVDLNPGDRLVWQAVARLWVSLAWEEGSVDIPAFAQRAVEWHQAEMVKLLPKEPPTVMNGQAKQPHGKNGERELPTTRISEEAFGGQPIREAKASVQATGNGMSRSFQRLIDMKIEEYSRKIHSLHALKERLGKDCDEALYEIIAPLLEKGE